MAHRRFDDNTSEGRLLQVLAAHVRQFYFSVFFCGQHILLAVWNENEPRFTTEMAIDFLCFVFALYQLSLLPNTGELMGFAAALGYQTSCFTMV